MFLALRYGVDPEDKLTIRNMAAREIEKAYPEEIEEEERPDYQWPD